MSDIFKGIGIGFDAVLDAYNSLDPAFKEAGNYPPFKITRTSPNRFDVEVNVAGYTQDDIVITLSDMVLRIKAKQGNKKRFFSGITEGDDYMVFLLSRSFHLDQTRVVDGILYMTFLTSVKEKRSLTIDFAKDKAIAAAADVSEVVSPTKVILSVEKEKEVPLMVEAPKAPEPKAPEPVKVEEVFEPVTVIIPEPIAEVKPDPVAETEVLSIPEVVEPPVMNIEVPVSVPEPVTVIEPVYIPPVTSEILGTIVNADDKTVPTTEVVVPDILTPVVDVHVQVAELINTVSVEPQVRIDLVPAEAVHQNAEVIVVPTPLQNTADIAVAIDPDVKAKLEAADVNIVEVISEAIDRAQPILPSVEEEAPEVTAAPTVEYVSPVDKIIDEAKAEVIAEIINDEVVSAPVVEEPVLEPVVEPQIEPVAAVSEEPDTLVAPVEVIAPVEPIISVEEPVSAVVETPVSAETEQAPEPVVQEPVAEVIAEVVVETPESVIAEPVSVQVPEEIVSPPPSLDVPEPVLEQTPASSDAVVPEAPVIETAIPEEVVPVLDDPVSSSELPASVDVPSDPVVEVPLPTEPVVEEPIAAVEVSPPEPVVEPVPETPVPEAIVPSEPVVSSEQPVGDTSGDSVPSDLPTEMPTPDSHVVPDVEAGPDTEPTVVPDVVSAVEPLPATPPESVEPDPIQSSPVAEDVPPHPEVVPEPPVAEVSESPVVSEAVVEETSPVAAQEHIEPDPVPSEPQIEVRVEEVVASDVPPVVDAVVEPQTGPEMFLQPVDLEVPVVSETVAEVSAEVPVLPEVLPESQPLDPMVPVVETPSDEAPSPDVPGDSTVVSESIPVSEVPPVENPQEPLATEVDVVAVPDTPPVVSEPVVEAAEVPLPSETPVEDVSVLSTPVEEPVSSEPVIEAVVVETVEEVANTPVVPDNVIVSFDVPVNPEEVKTESANVA